jgi:predicted O-linked N-acetylglucosamine transferase (SPINDLY family)
MAKKKKKASVNANSLIKQKPSKFQRELAQAFQIFQRKEYKACHDICVHILQHEPKNADAKMLLGFIASEEKNWAVAANFLADAVKVNARIAKVRFTLARAYQELNLREKAISHYKAYLSLNEGRLDALLFLGNCFADEERYEEAIETYEKMLEREPNSPAGLTNMGLMYATIGDMEKAISVYRYCSRLYPERAENVSNLLITQNYAPPNDYAKWFEKSKAYAHELFRRVLTQEMVPQVIGRGKIMRVGVVSADLYKHSVSHFLQRLLKHFDRSKMELIAYYSATQEDNFTAFVRDRASDFKSIAYLSTDEASNLIVDDQIDILIDLTGHFRHNRLDIFAKRSAPVQVAWLGYPNTTALNTMDYRLVDDITDPKGLTDCFYTEALYRLPRGFLCFSDDESVALSEEIPNKRTGFITFGCFNNSEKISPEVIRVWCEILARVANARLLLKSRHFANDSVRKRYLKLFSEAGVCSDQIVLRGFIKGGTHLELYNEVDLALDTFPYNGTTTTCQSLWMGVPTVTFTGDLHASRVSASILHRVGLDDFVADDVEGYIETAVKMAGQVDYLSELKVTLRDRMLKSDLCDGEGFARQMEEAFEWMLSQKNNEQV